MSDEKQQPDSLQPSWAAHELFALALTLVLAVWVVTKYGNQAQPPSLTDARAQERAEKRAELKAIDEKALTSFDVVDPALKRYRLPIVNAMSLLVEKGQEDPAGITKEIASRLGLPTDLKLVEFPNPDFLADESELADAALIENGKNLFKLKTCYTCHQHDPADPITLTGVALKAPQFKGAFWGKEHLAHDGWDVAKAQGGPLVKVVMNPGYFVDSIKNPGKIVVKGALSPMPPPPPPALTDVEIKALMAYVKSLSKEDE